MNETNVVTTEPTTCVVCGTTESGDPGWSMTLQSFSDDPAARTFATCKAHDDAIFLAIDGYDRHKSPQTFVVKRMTRDEAKKLRSGMRVKFVHYGKSLHGTPKPAHPVVMDAKVTSVKTWKTREDVEVRWHFGLSARDHGQSVDDHEGLMNDLVVVL